MNENLLIDVIVPVCNGVTYIRQFHDMFTGQADKRVRFIFIDDGSVDESLSLLRDVCAKSAFPSLVLHQAKGGISSALNTGINASDADYIAFFDIDDMCAKDYVKSLVDCVLSDDPFEVLVFKRQLIYSSHDSIPENGKCTHQKLNKNELLKNVLFDTRKYGNIHNIMVKREFINRIGLRFPDGYAYYEDYDFMYRAYAAADRIMYLDKWLYGYVVKHEGSVMAVYSPDKLKCMRLFKGLEKYLEETVPEFAVLFKQYALPRIYWSILWQTALVSPSYTAFLRFARGTCAIEYMRRLEGFPESKVKRLRALFLLSERQYYLVAKTFGRRYTSLKKTDEAVLLESAGYCLKPCEEE